jgi:hypothetical protein
MGEYKYGEIVIPDGIPAIVTPELFERAQTRLQKNKRAPAKAKTKEDYLLTTKLHCGKCSTFMVGESGNSKTGRTYHYYNRSVFEIIPREPRTGRSWKLSELLFESCGVQY